MTEKERPNILLKQFKRSLWIATALWTVASGLFFLREVNLIKSSTSKLAIIKARTHIDREMVLRFQAVSHGGVYVPVGDGIEPSLFLSYLEERDIITPSGVKLTLMTPASEKSAALGSSDNPLRLTSHLSSLNPLNPANTPDSWERKGLNMFTKGSQELLEFTDIDKEPHLRLMLPLILEPACIRCHASQGYSVGDVKGGVSVSLPMRSFSGQEVNSIITQGTTHALIWVLGLVGVAIGAKGIIRQIKRREKAETSLDNARSEMSAILATVGEGVAVIDGKSIIHYFNEELLRIFGYTRDKLVGKPIHTLIRQTGTGSGSVDILPTEMDQSSLGLRLEMEGQRMDGSVFPLEIRVDKTVVDEENTFFTAAMRDITDRKRHEKALVEKTAYLDNILRSSIDMAIAATTLDFRITYYNPTAEKIFGYTAEEAIGKTVQEIHTKEKVAADRFDRAIAIVRNEGEYRYSVSQEKEDGTHIIESRVSAITDPNGEAIGYVLMSRDVTERKRTEEELVRLATAIEQAAEVVVITDEKGSIQYVNPAFEKITGYTREEAIGKNPEILKSGAHDDSFYKALWDTILKGEVWNGNFVNKRRDGTDFESVATISPVIDQEGVITNFVCLQRDTSNEARLERQMRQSQKLQAVGTLAGGIAHDFNNILTSITGYTEMTIDDLPEGGEARQNLEEVLRASSRATDLIRQILAFSRKDERKTKPVHITGILKESLKLLRPSLPSTIEIVQNIDATSDTILGDSTQITQVIMNLCTNAEHAMQDKGGALRVGLSAIDIDRDMATADTNLHPGPYVLLSISDTGAGIEKEIQDRLFEPFFTTKARGEGTGMGLSVVHGIVASHGGAITVYSDPGVGSEFKVYLPRIIAASEEANETLKVKAAGGTERILIVDDEVSIVSIMKKTLERLGYQVHSANNPLEALELFRESPESYDIVLTDQTMPNMTGVELAENIMSIRSDIPIVLMTGFSRTMNEDKAKEKGVREVLMKPVTKSDLSEVIRRALS